jgi:GNAT superfamily N-acetyltransferase
MTMNPSTAPPAVVRLQQYGEAELREIFGDDTDPFGVASTGLTWLPKEVHFGIRRHGRLLAHTGLLQAPISVGEHTTGVVGFGAVAVAPDWRGQGLARLVVTVALEHARTMGPRHGLLFCRPPLVALYERLGWRTLPEEVRAEQPEGPVTMPLRTMWTPLHADAPWPTGPVRLRSLPF